MLQAIVIMAIIFQNSAWTSATRCGNLPLQNEENVWHAFSGTSFENQTLVVRGKIIHATNWSIEVNLILCTKPGEFNLSNCPYFGIDIGANHNNETEISRVWKQSAGNKIQERTHPGTYGIPIDGWLGMKLYSTNRNFPIITVNGSEVQTSDLFYCPDCILKYAYFRVKNFRLEEVFCADFDDTVWTGPEYHRLMLGQCEDTTQETTDIRKSYRLGVNKNFTDGHQMTFSGTINETWSVKLDLLACVQSNGSANDCFFLVFDARQSRNGKDIDCQVSKKSSASDLLEKTHHTFYNAIKSNGLIVKLFNLNDVLRIVFNEFEIRLSNLTYCENCTIQFVNLHLEGYRLKTVCYQTKDGRLRLPSTKLKVGQRSYKNTENSIKDVILENLQAGAYEVSYNCSVIGQNWQLKIYHIIYRPGRELPILLFSIAPEDDGATIRTLLEFVNEDAKEESYGHADMAFHSGGVTDIEVSVQYRSASNGKFRYQFFINGRNSSQSFTGPAFDRLQFFTHNASVEDVSLLSKSRKLFD